MPVNNLDGLQEKPKGLIAEILIARGFCIYLHRKCGRSDLSTNKLGRFRDLNAAKQPCRTYSGI
jgi:hypothetical protein